MSESKKIINENGLKFQLLSVNYDYIEPTEQLLKNTNEFETIIEDSYIVTDILEQHVEILFERKVFFDPKALYDIYIKIILKYKFNKNNEKSFDAEELKKEFDSRVEELLMPATIHSSVLVSQLTNVDSNDFPFIIPPTLMLNKTNVKKMK